jgi:putative membrane protein
LGQTEVEPAEATEPLPEAGAGQVPIAGEAAMPVTEAGVGEQDGEDVGAERNQAAASGPASVPAEELTSQQFVQTATVSSTFEIESGELAKEKSQSDEIRRFAERMIEDHTAAIEKLARAAQEDAAAVVDPYLDARTASMRNALEAAQPGEFDAQYVRMQVQAHEEAIMLFEAFSGREGALGAFAAETLPDLKEHLQMALSLQPE